MWTVWDILSKLRRAWRRKQRAWHLLQQMYPQRSCPKTSTAKGLSVRLSPPLNWVALFKLNKSMPETARTAENVEFNSCCTVAERRNSHSWKEDWQAKNRDPGWADTFSNSSRVPVPGKQHQITQTQLWRDIMVSRKLSLFIHCFTIRHLVLKHCHDWDSSVLTLWGKTPLIPCPKVHRLSTELKGKGWDMLGYLNRQWKLRFLHSGFNKALCQSTNCTSWNYSSKQRVATGNDKSQVRTDRNLLNQELIVDT